jgi:hypothetical protein
MRFREYLAELHNIEVGQAIEAHEPSTEGSSGVDNPKVRMDVNYHLANELNDNILSAEQGIQKIRKVLHRYGFDMPALYNADPEGDELIFELDQFGGGVETNLYILYYLTDEGHYEFYAEIGDDTRMDELISDGEEPEEE